MTRHKTRIIRGRYLFIFSAMLPQNNGFFGIILLIARNVVMQTKKYHKMRHDTNIHKQVYLNICTVYIVFNVILE